MDRLLTLSLRYRFFTLVAILMVIATGLWSFAHLTIDAVPDLTPVQVQVLTRATALGPVEVEQFVTFPIESLLNGLPALRELRSVSRYGSRRSPPFSRTAPTSTGPGNLSRSG